MAHLLFGGTSSKADSFTILRVIEDSTVGHLCGLITLLFYDNG
jgi:hypothetical protein